MFSLLSLYNLAILGSQFAALFEKENSNAAFYTCTTQVELL